MLGVTKKLPALVFVGICITFTLFASTAKKSALTLRANAMLKETVQESLEYLSSHITIAETDSDKRSILYYTGTLQEQMGFYADAGNSYAEAASISAPDAKGMPKVSTSKLYLFASRAFLACGDYDSSHLYLNKPALSKETDEEIVSLRKLYICWTDLCRSNSIEETLPVIETLKKYLSDSSMKNVKPSLLFTLWFLTGEDSYSEKLKKDYPSSPETGIAMGNIQFMGMPFWYFVPRNVKTFTPEDKDVLSAKAKTTATVEPSKQKEEPKKATAIKQQLGFFREKTNAENLITRLKQKGFAAYQYQVERSSGAIYYVVVVDEDQTNTMGQKLKAAGFECAPNKDTN